MRDRDIQQRRGGSAATYRLVGTDQQNVLLCLPLPIRWVRIRATASSSTALFPADNAYHPARGDFTRTHFSCGVSQHTVHDAVQLFNLFARERNDIVFQNPALSRVRGWTGNLRALHAGFAARSCVAICWYLLRLSNKT